MKTNHQIKIYAVGLLVLFFSLSSCDQKQSKNEKSGDLAKNSSNSEIDRTVLPIPFPPFKGKIGKTYKDSEQDWPKLVSAPEGAPNIVLIMLDDVGFGQTSTFGGSIPTPHLDQLASEGLKYNRFHTTAICSASRAALITGRNHHNASTGFLGEWATGFPSYNNMIEPNTATMGRIMKENGYNTSWYGKNHNTPDWESSIVGPYDRWPTGLGFDYFYGFIAGETNQYYPVLFENTTPVEQDKLPEEGYHFMNDMTNKAINWMTYSKSVNPDKPVTLYFAPGAAHAPHHAPPEWRNKFKGKFDAGWEVVREETYKRQLAMGIIPEGTKLTPKPEWVDSWDSLSADQKTLYTRLMENYAGFLAYTDYEIGRLLDAVKALPDADNTIVMYIVGDNGASAEGGMNGTINEIKSLSGIQTPMEENLKHLDEIGGPETEPHYPVGWAWSGNAPFQWVKQVASHFGGSRNPMVVSWPKVIKDKGGMRSQFIHLIDVLPTLMDASNIPAPKTVNGITQKPFDGVSFLSTFTDANAKPVRERQYFEIFSNRAVYDKGWIATAQHSFPWRQEYAPGNWENDKWELYNIDEDFSEANDLAAEMPEKLEEMKGYFDEEAKKNHVYPLDDRGTGRLIVPKPTPSDPNRTSFTFYEGATRLSESASPNTKNKSHSIIASVNLEKTNTSGTILAFGGGSAGFIIYVDNGQVVYDYNYFNDKHYVIKSSEKLPIGKSEIKLDFKYDGGGAGKGGLATLYINNKEVGNTRLEATVAARFGLDTFGVGEDSGAPVAHNYKPPFRFEGKINEVVIDLK